MAERVLVIDHGRVIADGTPEELKVKMAGDLITIGTDTSGDAARAAEVARRVDAHGEVIVDGSTVRLRTFDGATALAGLLRSLDAIGVNAVSAEVKRPTLDDVFLELTGRSLRDAGDIVAESIEPTRSDPLRPWRSRHDACQPHRDRSRPTAPPDVA